MRNHARDIAAGIMAFLPAAAGSAIVATLVYSCSGDVEPGRHESLPNLLTVYFGIAVFAGAVYGALRRWARTDIRFALMSIAVAWAVGSCLLLLVNRWSLSEIELWEVAAFGALGVLLGPPFGFFIRSQSSKA